MPDTGSPIVREALDDWAMSIVRIALALIDRLGQRSFQSPQLGNLFPDRAKLRRSQRGNVVTMVFAQCKQLANVIQAESQRLRTADEA